MRARTSRDFFRRCFSLTFFPHGVVHAAVSTADGFSYEREAIAEWLSTGKKNSPLTGAVLARTDLMPNHALRSAIQEFINANPALAKDLYTPGAATPAAYPNPLPTHTSAASSSSLSADSTDEAVPVGLPVTPVQAPPPPPLTGLTEVDRAAATPLAVPDWAAHCAPKKPPPARGWFSKKPSSEAASSAEAIDPDEEPRVRLVRPEDGSGGVGIEATLSTEASMLRLALRLAAPETAKLACLKLTASDGFGAGTAGALTAAGDGFALLCRALATALGGAESLSTLRELSISKINVSDAAAATLASALAGHPTLTSLELWNVALEDEGAFAVAQLAAPPPNGNAALKSLNLGRSLIGPEAREKLDAIIDRERVHAQLY